MAAHFHVRLIIAPPASVRIDGFLRVSGALPGHDDPDPLIEVASAEHAGYGRGAHLLTACLRLLLLMLISLHLQFVSVCLLLFKQVLQILIQLQLCPEALVTQ